jgi:hypothetical protein
MNEGYLTNQDLIVEGPNKMSSTPLHQATRGIA